MMRLNTVSIAAALLISAAGVSAQTPGGANAQPQTRPRGFEIFTVEGQPIDKRPPQLDTDHPVFPGQTHAPYHKTVDPKVTTIASGLDNPWSVRLLPGWINSSLVGLLGVERRIFRRLNVPFGVSIVALARPR